MKISILLGLLPVALPVADRAASSPTPVVCQYDTAGNRVTRAAQALLLNRSQEELQNLADSLSRQVIETTVEQSADEPSEQSGGTEHE